MTVSGSSSARRAISTSTADRGEPAQSGAPARLSLASGVVLLGATGYTDAYTYLRHGHVFAQAMTGNIVLIGVGTFDPGVVEFWRPLVTFGAFLAGVIALWLVAGRRSPARSGADSTQWLALVFEIAVLVVVGFLPHAFPQEVIVAPIAFAAGMQTSAFRGVDAASMSTIVMTTNSMQAVGAAFTALESGDPDDLARARALLLAIVAFAGGVFLGAGLSTVLHDRAAWPDAGLFLLATLLYWRDSHASRPTG